MKNPWIWAAVLGAGYLLFLRKATTRIPAPKYGDLPPPADVSRVDIPVDEYGMPMVTVGVPLDEGVALAEKIWGYSKVPTLDQLQRMNLGRGN